MNLKAQVLIAAISLRPDARVLVEIGCIREATESPTEGFSTVYLAQEAKARHSLLYSVDLNPYNIRVARAAVMAYQLSDSVRFHEGRGADWLKGFADPIDFLYLDGSDDPQTNLEEFKAAETKLAPDAIVCIDDCHAYLGRQFGKGDKVIPYAIEQGWMVRLVPTLHPWRTAILQRGEGFDTPHPFQGR